MKRLWCKIFGHDWWSDHLGLECRRCFQCATLERCKSDALAIHHEWVEIPEKRILPGTHHSEAVQFDKNTSQNPWGKPIKSRKITFWQTVFHFLLAAILSLSVMVFVLWFVMTITT